MAVARPPFFKKLFQLYSTGKIFCRFQKTDGVFQILSHANHAVTAQKSDGTTSQGIFDTLMDGMCAMLTERQTLDVSKDLV